MKRTTIAWVVACALGVCLFVGCTDAGSKGNAEEPKKDAEMTPEKTPEKPPETPPKEDPPKVPEGPHPGLLDPSQAKEKAPEKFKVKLNTTKGDVLIEVTREWSPNGADRFYNLVKIGYFTDVAFFRVLTGFMAQFGINGDPKVNAKWSQSNVKDDPVRQSNLEGFVTFAKASMPNSRSTQLFINYGDNSNLDGMGFSPIGKVLKGMDAVRSLYADYGEGAPRGKGPAQGRVQGEGNKYLKQFFPNLDYIKTATIEE